MSMAFSLTPGVLVRARENVLQWHWDFGFAYFVRSIYSQLAMHARPALDLTFHALADATRRSMIHALANGETRSASELGRQFRSAQPTISQHLKVLEEAGILERKVEGRLHQFRLRRKALAQAGRWIGRHQAFWEGALDQLDRLLAEGASDDRG
jgi:DNA-binding transcriptional ArsR family regulator